MNTCAYTYPHPVLMFMLIPCATLIQDFNAYKEHLISTQSPENQTRLNDEYKRLLANLQRNLEPSNRDRFAQKLTIFRINVQGFLTV